MKESARNTAIDKYLVLAGMHIPNCPPNFMMQFTYPISRDDFKAKPSSK